MKKLIVFGIAICTTVLSISLPALADWKPFVRNTNERLFYYDENFTHPIKPHSDVIVARLMGQGRNPYYLMFSCFSTRGGVSVETSSTNSEPLAYTIISTADTNRTINSTFRVQYCQGQARRNLEIMNNITTQGDFMNGLIQNAARGH